MQNYPSYDYRYLKTLLARQLQAGGDAKTKAIELTSVLQESDPDSVAQDETSAATPPATRDELFRYDVVIFGDVNPAVLGASLLDHLHEFVAGRGGGLVVLSGPRFTPLAYRDTPLASLLPINLDSATAPPADSSLAAEARVRLTPLGQGSPVLQLTDDSAENQELWKQLPPWYWWIEAGEVRPGARVLAEHPTRTDAEGRPLPMVCVQFIGAGKVVFHASDDSWRWSRGPAGEQAYARYWLQTLRYLSRSKLAAAGRSAQLTSDRDEYEQGDVGRLRVRFFDERRAPADDQGVSVVMERDGGRRQTLRLGRDSTGRADFTAAMPLSLAGSYRAWLAT
ncbi:MAG TPA: hypothetical protein PLV92_30090, partial [Pirellulaceae bacterium]|nr:hypothetical protein [Pirellulaceae bacterium]